eukprot:TRINITY_DN1131_c0_g1_i1.p1 TRINITY_DN1131_c0_g1~~TRINITY_DN1131_c0_g1_i1.p1  ORF type:complete len:117 (-),score=16.57 TRINITY_DN1131_c0_g1_i1:51-401(-)
MKQRERKQQESSASINPQLSVPVCFRADSTSVQSIEGLSSIHVTPDNGQRNGNTLKPPLTRSVSMSQMGHYGVIGTPQWMVPEVMEGQKYNQKIDIYGYGIVLTELLSRQIPFNEQ